MTLAQPRVPLARLVELAQSAGVSYAGLRRDELLARLIAAADAGPAHATAPLRLCSLDMGYRNFAHAQLRIDAPGAPPVLERWEKTPVDVPEPFEPTTFATAMRTLVDRLVAPADGIATVYLVERQSFRGSGGRYAIPGGIMMLNRIEAALHVLLAPRDVRSIDPRMVARTLGLEERGPAKKRSAVRVVRSILSESQATNGCPPPVRDDPPHDVAEIPLPTDRCGVPASLVPSVNGSLRAYFTSERKKDDLSDALLQAVAYLSWQQQIAAMRGMLHL